MTTIIYWTWTKNKLNIKVCWCKKIICFKDTFWSTSDEPGSPYKPSGMEPLPEREIVLAVLSTGPVGPGDAINYTNGERIMKCCRQDGLILKPDRPISMIDVLIADWAQHDGAKQGQLYSTESTM